MTVFVLVHGAFHGGWCWHRITSRLGACGHRVFAPDLAGHGIDATPRSQVTMDLIVRRLCKVLDESDGAVTLVGHSLGGVVISNLAEQRPSKINRLVYVTAFLMEAGNNSVSVLADDVDQLGPHVSISSDGQLIVPNLESIGDYLYNMCDDDDVALAQSLLVPENVSVASARVVTTEEK